MFVHESYELLSWKMLLFGKQRFQAFNQMRAIRDRRGPAIATNKKRITTTHSVLDPNLIGIELTASLNSRFLFAFFERFDLRNLQDSTPIPQLNKNDVEGVSIPLSPDEERLFIGELMETMHKKIAALASEAQRLDELFFALLEELMGRRLSAHAFTNERAPR